MTKITGQDLLDYIKENKLEEHTVVVTAKVQHDGDHDCPETDKIGLQHADCPKELTMYIGEAFAEDYKDE